MIGLMRQKSGITNFKTELLLCLSFHTWSSWLTRQETIVL
jgi:hypothetical protein